MDAGTGATRIQDRTAGRILDAAFGAVERFGLARTTIADVAESAGCSRQTVYRYFPNKHALFAGLVMREEGRLIVAVRAAVEPHEGAREAMEAGILTCLEFMRDHPLLAPIMKAEPEQLLPYLTVDAHPLIDIGMRTAEELFGRRVPGVSPATLRRVAEVWARTMQSYSITPPVDPPEDVAASLADLFCRALGVPDAGRKEDPA